MRIGIAGGGLMGRLMAHGCSQVGHAVQVFEAGPEAPAVMTARAAAFTSAGMLSPIAEMEAGGEAVYDLGIESMRLWPQIHKACNHAFDLRINGSLMVCHPADRASAERVLAHTRPGATEPQPTPLASQDLESLEPALKPRLHGWMLPNEGHLFPAEALDALREYSPNSQWRFNTPVMEVRAGSIRTEHDELHFDWVFDCRGLGARSASLPLRGVRGEIFTLMPPTGCEIQRPIRLMHPRWRVYLVPRPSGEIVVGATEIESEDRSPTSVQSNLELLSAAFSIAPSLAEARIVSSDVNLRPALPDNLPQLVSEPGLTAINGLFRHGWLLAPALMHRALVAMGAERQEHALV
ncbi:MAG: hypothetical protein RLY67_521 [Pseudomonadota bacterium]|jgi:glycine oxidase